MTNGLSFFVGSQETIGKVLRSNQYRHRLCRVVATNSQISGLSGSQ